MLKSYIQTAIRSLRQQKFLASITIFGLSIGIACFALFLLYTLNEFNFDRFHTKATHIYRAYRWSAISADGRGQSVLYLPMPFGPALKNDIPEVKNFVRVKEAWDETFIKIDDRVLQIPVSFADPSFFDVFTFPTPSGADSKAMHNLHDVVLTEKTAKRIFGDVNAVGRSIEMKVQDEYESFIISAVVDDIPSNSSIHFDILANFEYFMTTRNGTRSVDNWSRPAFLTYVELQPENTSIDIEEQTLQSFYNKYYPGEEADLRRQGRWNGAGSPNTYKFQSLEAMHTDTKVNGARVNTVDPGNIWILLAVAGGVLLIACINFTVLSIGRSANRAREVGIRKVVGSDKKSLFIQFISESLVLTTISTVVGLILGRLLLPLFNQLSGKELVFSFYQFPELIFAIIFLVFAVGFLAGIYPAVIVSSFKTLEVLKQKIKVGGANTFTRALVTLQFVLSIGLMACTAIILQQINFMTGRHPGFNKENIVVVNGDDVDTRKIFPLFKQMALDQTQVNGVAGSELGLGEGTGLSLHPFDYEGEHKEVYQYAVDAEFIPLMGIRTLTGRNFNDNISADTMTSVIINEAMVKDFGWTVENALGKTLTGYYGNADTKSPIVIGVVENLNFRTMREEVKPQLFYQSRESGANKYFVSLKAGNPEQTLKALASVWKTIVPELPFRYSFLDQDLDRFYKEETRWGNIVGWAGGISIFLACLGLLGLASLTAVNKTREIGIRKVHGATTTSIVASLSMDFLKLVLLALCIAIPMAGYYMNLWLEGFAYRVSVSWLALGTAGFAALVLSFIAISFQVIKVARLNPVRSLKAE